MPLILYKKHFCKANKVIHRIFLFVHNLWIYMWIKRAIVWIVFRMIRIVKNVMTVLFRESGGFMKFGQKMIMGLFLLICLVSGWMQPGSARSVESANAKEADARKVTIVSIPGLSFKELEGSMLQRLPQLERLLRQGRIGALNVRTQIRGIEDSYLTIGAGAPAAAKSMVNAFHREERINGQTAIDLYARFHGTAPVGAQIVVPEIAALIKQNAEQHYGTQTGLLGHTLRHHGVEIQVYGNRDRGFNDNTDSDMRKRHAALMVMDREGAIGAGDIGDNTLITAAQMPYGVKTNYEFIYQEWKKAKSPGVIVIELGDLDRLYDQYDLYSEETFAKLKVQILKETADFLHKLSTEMRPEDIMWMMSPMTHGEAMKEKSMLTPIFYYKPGLEEGLLISSTTRRHGIAANYDLGTSVLHNFGIAAPEDMVGLPLAADATPFALEHLLKELDRIERVYILRPQLLYPFVTYEVIVLIISLIIVLRGWQSGIKSMRIPLLSILSAPLILLWMGWLAGTSSSVLTVFFIATLLAMSWLTGRLPILAALGITATTVSLFILFDGLSGADAMKRSVLGYDPMIGARYYGIGNEYMGVLIGAVILGVSVWLQQWHDSPSLDGSIRRYRHMIATGVGLIFIGIVAYMAAPGLGTNAGGAVTATIALGVAWVRFFCGSLLKEVRWGRITLLLSGLLLLSFGGLWLLNVVLPQNSAEQSHIGRALHLLFSGRLDLIMTIMLRKLAMNWHLIGVSSWSKVLITSMFVMTVMVMRPRGVFGKWQVRYPYIMYGFSANTVGAITALIFNDSGIVAAATMIGYVAVPMLLLKLTPEQAKSTGSIA
jgi:hypothetical protein